MQPPRNLPQIPIWKGELGILNIYYSIKFLKIKWIQRSMHPTPMLPGKISYCID